MNVIGKLSVTSTMLFTLAIPAAASVVINSPANNAEVASTFNLSATSISCASEDVTQMGYSIDSSADSTIFEGKSLELPVSISAGTHVLHVKAVGEHGTMCVEDVTVTVKDAASLPLNIPSDAKSVSNIQSLDRWKYQHDTGGKGRASGGTKLVTSPSLHGNSREFETSYSSGGDERFSIVYAEDEKATHFFYDGWVYFTNSASHIGNLELDTNQVVADGKLVIFGVQCDGYSGTWAYTANVGTEKHGKPHWERATKTKCNPREWSRNKWHHIQAYYSRNESGSKVTYHSVWVDGVESKINATVNGLFDLHWRPIINTQFQIDGVGSSGSTKVYLDNLTISRW